jgi:glycosyltransferase involved in cell wall biosynthesis
LDIPSLYQLWDGLLYLSGGEGFGLPAWEAMCAGLPTIYTNYSGHADFLGKAEAGLPVGGILQPEAKTCIWRMVADVSQVVEAVRRLYFDRNLAALLGANGREFVKDYAPDRMAEKWHSIFQTLTRSRETHESAHAPA